MNERKMLMSSFRFGLQRLLGYRNIQEDEAKRELGLRHLALEKEIARLSGLKREEESIIEQWRSQVHSSEIELPRLQVTQEYSRLLENRLTRQAEQYHRSKGRVEEQREVAMQCWQKKRMLEVLQGKARLEHQRQEQIMERNLIDEIVLNTYTRKGGE
ncbi:MAG: flagellar export protein FliJ [Dethiobacteria bacterium]|nr:flagellar export protein FliJ [Dethiobacteria bacterium]